eukprot:3867849-Prymnesium_polylepis.1
MRLVALLKLPCLHGSGADAPRGQYEPDSQVSQLDAEIVPAAQVVGATEAVAHELPGGHKVQRSFKGRSVAFENEPFVHGSGTAVPLGHAQPGMHSKQ